MVARIWRGATRAVDADRYRAYLEETGLRDFARTPGSRGALALRRDVGDRTEWTIVSLWESVDAIRAFAGDDVTKARFYPTIAFSSDATSSSNIGRQCASQAPGNERLSDQEVTPKSMAWSCLGARARTESGAARRSLATTHAK